MKTEVITSIDKFVIQQQIHQGCLRLLRRIGGSKLVIAELERDMARDTSRFLFKHAFPNVLPRNGGNKLNTRRTRPQAGSERVPPTTPATKGKKNI